MQNNGTEFQNYTAWTMPKKAPIRGGVSFDAIFFCTIFALCGNWEYHLQGFLGSSPACTGDRPRNRRWDPAGWTASPRPGPKMCNFFHYKWLISRDWAACITLVFCGMLQSATYRFRRQERDHFIIIIGTISWDAETIYLTEDSPKIFASQRFFAICYPSST